MGNLAEKQTFTPIHLKCSFNNGNRIGCFPNNGGKIQQEITPSLDRGDKCIKKPRKVAVQINRTGNSQIQAIGHSAAEFEKLKDAAQNMT
jgi:hypothetical protein